MYQDKLTKRQYISRQVFQMELERQPFVSMWRDIAENFSPSRQRFQVTDNNRNNRQNSRIIDSTPVFARKTLRAGMTGGVASPARPWFKLVPQDFEMAEFAPVKNWLWEVQEIMYAVLRRSNTYTTLPQMFDDCGTYGTSPIGVFETFSDQVIHTECYPIGSYSLGQDANGKVNEFSRTYRMTVGQVVKRFGNKIDGEPDWSKFSKRLKDQYERGNLQTWVTVTFYAGPNTTYVPNSPWSINKPWIGVYYETGCGGQESYGRGEDDIMLEEKGYDFFPILTDRWEKNVDDTWATDCPGMTALGDAKQLQIGERRSLEAIEKMVRPPLMAPTAMRGKENAMVPGHTTYFDLREGAQGIKSVYDVRFDISQMEGKQEQVRMRINRAFYADLFLMLSNIEDRERTAYEVAERKEEKLLALGPTLELANGDVFDPFIDIVFYTCLRRRMFPPIPEELKGMPIKIEYTSVTAQAQKLIGIATMDRFLGSMATIAGFDPRALRKIKGDQLVDVYAEMLSVNPSVVRSDEEVAAIDAAEAQAQAQAEQLAMIQQGAQAAESLSKTNTTGDNALNDLLAIAQAGQ